MFEASGGGGAALPAREPALIGGGDPSGVRSLRTANGTPEAVYPQCGGVASIFEREARPVPDLAEAWVVTEDFRLEYNHRWPHSSLGYDTPAAFAAKCRQAPPLRTPPARWRR